MTELFNDFFTSLESKSTASVNECNEFITNRFRELKNSGVFNHINDSGGSKLFEFVPINTLQLEKLMDELSNTSSPGVIKAATETLTPLFTGLFNLCFEQNSMPSEWKMAIVNPLFKKKRSV